MTMDFATLAPLFALLAAVGVFAGLIAGLLGIGGGAVLVPAFYYVFSALGFPQDHLMHVAVGTSLATIVFTSQRSVRTHSGKGAVDWELLKAWAPWVAGGAALGGLVAGSLDTRGLMIVFGSLALLTSAQMGLGNPKTRLGEAPPAGGIRAAWGLGLGFLSALMGIGGGAFGVAILSLYGVAIHRAIGTASGFGFIIALPSMLLFILTGWGEPNRPPYSLGYVNIPAFLLITPLTALLAPYGARLAHKLDVKPLKRIFAIFLGLIALNMLRKALLG
ncbi:sulfite exporter TauE/SafE family protein [Neomegalonema perideroedes]|uniref:sulfite exporter TauE/SafE family protein n=1 Tax=Neomegalonema perideroedes TaxID=217219 RepID=UPI00036C072E|nr:sulfite exporter TauE/SafE family protein [Neomegalonema perideroedes]